MKNKLNIILDIMGGILFIAAIGVMLFLILKSMFMHN
jgi:hypothetical protein